MGRVTKEELTLMAEGITRGESNKAIGLELGRSATTVQRLRATLRPQKKKEIPSTTKATLGGFIAGLPYYGRG